jgi:hypothetical protein
MAIAAMVEVGTVTVKAAAAEVALPPAAGRRCVLRDQLPLRERLPRFRLLTRLFRLLQRSFAAAQLSLEAPVSQHVNQFHETPFPPKSWCAGKMAQMRCSRKGQTGHDRGDSFRRNAAHATERHGWTPYPVSSPCQWSARVSRAEDVDVAQAGASAASASRADNLS